MLVGVSLRNIAAIYISFIFAVVQLGKQTGMADLDEHRRRQRCVAAREHLAAYHRNKATFCLAVLSLPHERRPDLIWPVTPG